MKIDGKRLTFPSALNVKYSATVIEENEHEITIEAEDEESYLKIYTPFRGVAKLFVFENGQWIDAETSTPFAGLDLASLGLGDLNLDAASEEESAPSDLPTDDKPNIIIP
jgi:hypothetical protein